MPVTVRFFASLAEQFANTELGPVPGTTRTVEDVWREVTHGAPMPGNVLCAVNLEHASPGAAVRDGDEVAFFPPVTGG